MSRVLARRGMPRGRISRAFRNGELKNFDELDRKFLVYLDLDADGYIVVTDTEGGTLPPNTLTLAGDVQNKNLELYTEGDDVWRLRLLKDVAPDDKVELWFSEEIIGKIDMPFLTPRNIRGRKNYTCHDCGTQFEQPNPLKIHLFLSCQEFTAHKFWRKFLAKIKEQNLPLNLSLDGFAGNLNLDRPKSHENRPREDTKNSSRCNSEPPFSAFKPYKIGTEAWYNHFNNNAINVSLVPPRLITSDLAFHHAYTLRPNLAVQNEAYRNWQNVTAVSKSLERVSVTNPAEIETLATNWGKSKEGHLCLYCGKIYSRKYGLKIHIRTHTGYKPLQCKYCLRPFGDPSNLNKHVRLHAQSETPYSCNLCGKMLVRKRDLERHLRSRHGDDVEMNKLTSIIRDSPSP